MNKKRIDNQFSTHIIARDANSQARVTEASTPHGQFTTPCFMPVATRAYVNCMTTAMLADAGSQIILGGNTYHMLCNPGLATIEAIGGMHSMMAWQQPMLTDSGGFQVFSLSRNEKLCKIDENGARFRHPNTGETLYLNAETSLQAQRVIGADIIMAFDQCTPDVDDRSIVLQALQRTHRWLEISKNQHAQNPNSTYGKRQAFFGIIQGGPFKDLREQSAKFIAEMDCDGIAIGGESIGFAMDKTIEIIDWVRPWLDENKLRYTMGVGLNPQDLLDVVKAGIDIFDCVAPTRNARHGALYAGELQPDKQWLRFANEYERSHLLIKKSIFRHDERPIMASCECHTCQHHSRAYLHYLFKQKSPLYYPLACCHNVAVMHQVCAAMRELILASS